MGGRSKFNRSNDSFFSNFIPCVFIPPLTFTTGIYIIIFIVVGENKQNKYMYLLLLQLTDFSQWCMSAGVKVLTVYAFSTENWNRDPKEVAVLMGIFAKYAEKLRKEALLRNVRVVVLSTGSI